MWQTPLQLADVWRTLCDRSDPPTYAPGATSLLSLHEVIPARHKLYCDLDISFSEEEWKLLDHPDVGGKQALVDDIILSARQAEVILQRGGTDEPHTRFHYREAHKENAHKISFHIVWNHCSEDLRVTRAFAMFYEKCLTNRDGIANLTRLPKHIKSYESLLRLLKRPGGFVDFGVYTNNHSLRTAGASKNFDPYSTLHILPQSLAQGEQLAYSHRDLISYTLPTWRPVTADTHTILRSCLDLITPRRFIVLEARLRSDVLTAYCDRAYEKSQEVGLGMLVTTAFNAIEEEYQTPVYSFNYFDHPDNRGMKVTFSLVREEDAAQVGGDRFYWELDVYTRTCTKYQSGQSPREPLVSFFITASGQTRRFSHDFPERWLDLEPSNLPFYTTSFTTESRHMLEDPLCDRLNSLMASARNGQMCDEDRQLYEEIGRPAALFDGRCDAERFCFALEERIPLPEKSKVVFVKSACGTGKTTLMKYFLLRASSLHRNGYFDVDTQFEEFSVCFVTVRRTLADTIGQEFKGMPYGDFVDYRTLKGPIRHPRVIVQMDSIGRVAHYGFDVVIIDECVSALTHICSDTVGKRRDRVYGQLVQTMKEARQVVCMDADVNNDSVRLVQEMVATGHMGRPFDVHVTVNTMRTDPSSYDIYRFLDPFMEQVLEMLIHRKKMVVCCETKKDAYAMYNYVLYLFSRGYIPFYPPNKVRVLTGESGSDDKIEMSRNASRTWCKYNLVIITSVIFVGVDHSPATPHFDCIALMGVKTAFGNARYLDPRQLLQMRWRCRSTNDKRVIVYAPDAPESNVKYLGVFSDSVSMAQYDKLKDVVKEFEFGNLFAAECYHAFFSNLTQRFYNTYLTSMIKRQVQDPDSVVVHEEGEPGLFVARKRALPGTAISDVQQLIDDNGRSEVSQERKGVYMDLRKLCNSDFASVQLTEDLFFFLKTKQMTKVRKLELVGGADNLDDWLSRPDIQSNKTRVSNYIFKQLYAGALQVFGADDLWALMKKLQDEEDYDALLESFAYAKPMYKGRPVELSTFFKINRVELEVLHYVRPFNPSAPGKCYVDALIRTSPVMLPLFKDSTSRKSKFMQVLEAVYYRHKKGFNELRPAALEFIESSLNMYVRDGTNLRSSFASVLGAPPSGVALQGSYGVLEQSLPTKRILERAEQRCSELYSLFNRAGGGGRGVQGSDADDRPIIRAPSFDERPAVHPVPRPVIASEGDGSEGESDDEWIDEEETDEEGEYDTGHDGPHRFVAA